MKRKSLLNGVIFSAVLAAILSFNIFVFPKVLMTVQDQSEVISVKADDMGNYVDETVISEKGQIIPDEIVDKEGEGMSEVNIMTEENAVDLVELYLKFNNALYPDLKFDISNMERRIEHVEEEELNFLLNPSFYPEQKRTVYQDGNTGGWVFYFTEKGKGEDAIADLLLIVSGTMLDETKTYHRKGVLDGSERYSKFGDCEVLMYFMKPEHMIQEELKGYAMPNGYTGVLAHLFKNGDRIDLNAVYGVYLWSLDNFSSLKD